MKTRVLLIVRAFLFLVCTWAVAPAFAGNTNGYEGAKWAFLDAQKMLAAAAEITVEKYPDSDEATVEKKMVRVYRPDGTGECQDEAFVKVLTEKGKRSNRTLSLYYMLPYSTVEVVKVEVMKPDGEVVVADVAANSKEMIDDSQMGMNIYDPNSKILQMNIPKVEIGDVVHSITRTTLERSYIPGEFAEDNVFEGPGFTRHMSYEVYAPAVRPLKRIVLRDEVRGTVKYSKNPGENKGTLHRWEMNNVPRMFDEPSMPPYEMVLQRLLVSTTPDWQAVSKWYWNVSKPHLDATTPEMRAHLLTALGVSIPLGAITVFLMSIALKARANKVVTGAQGLVGEIGIAQTPLSPHGKVFVHGELWDATSTVSVAAGQTVVVRGVDGLQLRVDPSPAVQHTPAATMA